MPTGKIIRDNVESLDVTDICQIVVADTFYWIDRNTIATEHPWVVFCSPPYDLYTDMCEQMVELIAKLVEAAPLGSIFVVEADAQPLVIELVETLGYETLHRSTGYSNHLHADTALGRVDFVYVGGETAHKLFAGSRVQPGPGGFEVPVPRPEHLAAMKVQAMKNDPSRSLQELSDIRFLLALPGVDRTEVQGYFEKHGLLSRFEELDESS